MRELGLLINLNLKLQSVDLNACDDDRASFECCVGCGEMMRRPLVDVCFALCFLIFAAWFNNGRL